MRRGTVPVALKIRAAQNPREFEGAPKSHGAGHFSFAHPEGTVHIGALRGTHPAARFGSPSRKGKLAVSQPLVSLYVRPRKPETADEKRG